MALLRLLMLLLLLPLIVYFAAYTQRLLLPLLHAATLFFALCYGHAIHALRDTARHMAPFRYCLRCGVIAGGHTIRYCLPCFAALSAMLLRYASLRYAVYT